MDVKNKDMDNFYTKSVTDKTFFSAHTRTYRRQFNVIPVLDAVGYFPKKKRWHKTKFKTWNFSIILSGTGTYHASGKEYKVQAPCVLTQQPEVFVNYGPDSSWEELFFIYDSRAADKLITGNVFPGNGSAPVWYFNNSEKTLANIRSFMKSMDLVQYQQYADTIDISAYNTIISTITLPSLANLTKSGQKEYEIIFETGKYIRLNPAETVNIDFIASKNGMHPARFRRLWNKVFNEPPLRYALRLRLIQAAKLLVESTIQIQEIADITGFSDALYFSRLFKLEYGIAPKFYREKYSEFIKLGKDK